VKLLGLRRAPPLLVGLEALSAGFSSEGYWTLVHPRVSQSGDASRSPKGFRSHLEQASAFAAEDGGTHDGGGEEDHRPDAEGGGEFGAVAQS
jgi:hypothetical protein